MAKTPLSRAAQMLSKVGASKGGKARAAKLTAEERRAIARKAVEARWRMTEAERRAARETLHPMEIGDLTLEADGDCLRLTIAAQHPTMTLTDIGVNELMKQLRSWRRWRARQQPS